MGQTYRSISPSAMIENIIALRAQESVGRPLSVVWLESGRFRLVDEMKDKMWGVSTKRNKWGIEKLEHVDFTVKVADDEAHIIRRLEREKRVGKVEKLDDNTYRFTADVYDVSEMIPWIRTFICRIIDMNFTSRTLETQFKSDLDAMYRMYGIGEVSK